MSNHIPVDHLSQKYQHKKIESFIDGKIRQESINPSQLVLIGDHMLENKLETRAKIAYEKALELEPANPTLLNKLAWLLLTSENIHLRDPRKALTLARTAITLRPQGYILDTLATAYWANNYLEEAFITETKAMRVDPAQRRYYRAQITRFQEQSYTESLTRDRDKYDKATPQDNAK